MLPGCILDRHLLTENPLSGYLSGHDFLPCSVAHAMTLKGHRGCINTCSFNPYGDRELTGCDDGCVWLWDIGDRLEQPKLRLRPHTTNVFTTNFLSGNRFLSGGNDATVQVAEIRPDGRTMSTVYHEHHIRKVMCSFVIDEFTFATCSYDRTVRLFDTRMAYTNQRLIDLPTLTDADLDYNGMRRLSEDLNQYNIRPQSHGGGLTTEPPCAVDNASLLIDFRSKQSAELFTMDAHPIDRKRFITSGNDGTVRLFDLRNIRKGIIGDSGFCVNHKYRAPMNVTGAVYSDDGNRIAATVIGGAIHVLDANASIDLTTLPPVQPRRRGQAIDLSEIVDESGAVDMSRLEQVLMGVRQAHEEEEEEDRNSENAVIAGEMIELKGHISEQTIKTCNWYGKFVVTGSDDGSVFFYDADTGKIMNILHGHEGSVNVVTVHREKKLLATSGIDSYSILWEPRLIGKADRDKIEQDVEEYLAQEHEEAPACNVQ